MIQEDYPDWCHPALAELDRQRRRRERERRWRVVRVVLVMFFVLPVCVLAGIGLWAAALVGLVAVLTGVLG